MRIVFCDDDPMILQQLQRYVKEFFANLGGSLPEFIVYPTGDLLIQQGIRADIAFLDVEMPGVSGIYAGAILKEQNPHIKIFIVTAYPDYLDEAMRFQVFRYLSKPIDKTRLFRNLKDAVFAYNIESQEYPILTDKGVFTRRSEEILCVETTNRKTTLHTLDGQLLSNNNIDYWRKTLDLPCFFTTHRSYIVNMRYVYAIQKDTVILKSRDKELVAFLARRKHAQFKDAYLLYMESSK